VHLDPTQKTKLGELLSRQAQAGVAMGAAVLGAGDAAAGKDDVFAIQRETRLYRFCASELRTRPAFDFPVFFPDFPIFFSSASKSSPPLGCKAFDPKSASAKSRYSDTRTAATDTKPAIMRTAELPCVMSAKTARTMAAHPASA
jgi:hypothetical protein